MGEQERTQEYGNEIHCHVYTFAGPSEGSLKWCGKLKFSGGCGKWMESICDVVLYELWNRPKFFCYIYSLCGMCSLLQLNAVPIGPVE